MKKVYIVCFFDQDFSGNFTLDIKNTKASALACLFHIVNNFNSRIDNNDDYEEVLFHAEAALKSSNFSLLEYLLNDYFTKFNDDASFIYYEIKEQELSDGD